MTRRPKSLCRETFKLCLGNGLDCVSLLGLKEGGLTHRAIVKIIMNENSAVC